MLITLGSWVDTFHRDRTITATVETSKCSFVVYRRNNPVDQSFSCTASAAAASCHSRFPAVLDRRDMAVAVPAKILILMLTPLSSFPCRPTQYQPTLPLQSFMLPSPWVPHRLVAYHLLAPKQCPIRRL